MMPRLWTSWWAQGPRPLGDEWRGLNASAQSGRRNAIAGAIALGVAGLVVGFSAGTVAGRGAAPAAYWRAAYRSLEQSFWQLDGAYRRIDASFWQLRGAFDRQTTICTEIAANAQALTQVCRGAGDRPPRALFTPPAFAPSSTFASGE